MSKRKRKKAERDDRRLRYAKATVGAVLEQCSVPELAVLIRFFERSDLDQAFKVAILASAAYDIRAARKAEDAATKKAARKLSRSQGSEEIGSSGEPMPQIPIPDSAKPQH